MKGTKHVVVFCILLLLVVPILSFSGGQEEIKEGEAAEGFFPGMPDFSQVTIASIGRRFPATEAEAKLMDEVPWATVNAMLLPGDAQMDKTRIELSSGSSAIDIIYTSTAVIPEWYQHLEPLNEYIEKYWDVYNFGDIAQSAWNEMSVDGKIYGIPTGINTSILFYREDLLQQKGISVPNTFDEFLSSARKLNSDDRAGVAFTLKRGDGLSNMFGYFLWSCGGRFFDEKWNPVFDKKEGLLALEYMKKFMPYTPPDVLNYWVDEVMVDLQQDKTAMSVLWASRCLPMDDPKVSKVVNKVQYALPPSLSGVPPCTRTSTDGYSVNKYGKNKEQAFHVIAYAASEGAQKRIADLHISPRTAVSTDPEVVKKFRWYASTLETFKTSRPLPPIPEWWEIANELTTQIQKYLIGQIGAEEALEIGRVKAYDVLKEAGYYK